MATIERRCSLCIMAEFILRLLFVTCAKDIRKEPELNWSHYMILAELKSGDKGTVRFVDAYGKIFVDWDCGISLGLIYEDDVFRIIE